MLQIRGISEGKLDKIIEAAQKLTDCGFKTGLHYKEKRARLVKITTGSSVLDGLLGGGIESQAITEIFGEYRTGKTQLCHTLCVTAQLGTKQGGGQGKVIYIDTEQTFRPERIKSIAERYDLDPDQTLDNILVAEAWTTDRLQDLLT